MNEIHTTNYPFIPYAKGLKDSSAMRVSAIWYKGEGKEQKKPCAIYLPLIAVGSQEFLEAKNAGKFDGLIVEALEKVQDAIVRAKWEESNYSLHGLTQQETSIDAILASLNASGRTSVALTSDAISGWFTQDFVESYAVLRAETQGYAQLMQAWETHGILCSDITKLPEMAQMQSATLAKHLKAWEDSFKSVGAFKKPEGTPFGKEKMLTMRAALDVHCTESAIGTALAGKLDNFLARIDSVANDLG
jgi:hypothetical protein